MSLIMNQNKILGHAALLMVSTLIMAIYYILKALRNSLKRQFYNAYNCFALTLIFTAMALKLNYEYFHPLMLIIPLIIIIVYDIYFSKKYEFLKTEFLPIIILTIFFIFISDRQILTYFNPKLTEYNANKSLGWDSFQGQPDIKMDGESYILPAVKYKLKEIKGTNSSGVVICGIYKDSSWTINTNTKNLKVLEYYLKISEIYTRKMRKLFDNENRKKQLLEKINILKAEYAKDKDLYSREVLDNNYPETHNNWKERIDTDLNALSNFE